MSKLIFVFIFIISTVHSAPNKAGSYIESKSKIKNPFELRDPFKPPLIRSKKIAKTSTGAYRDGVYTNLLPHQSLEIGNFKIVGIIVGPERRAMAKFLKTPATGKDKTEPTFVLKEGMKIGQEKAELKAILPGGVVFVEKITNVYGQDEYLETVIPISQE